MSELEKEYLTIQQAAQYCGASEAALRNRIQRGLLRTTTIFGVKVVAKKDLEAKAASGSWS